METEPNQLNGSGRVPWRLMKAQVAVAMAVVRSRPPGVSSRQHSEALGRTLRRQDGAWRERAQALQQEVLRLQQELLVSRATDNTNSSWETADEAIMEDLSQDLFGPGSPAFSADPPPDHDSETPDLLLHYPPPPPPPPLPSSSSRLRTDPWSDALLPHMRFLQSLCSLQRLDGSSVALAPEGHGGSAASETVFLLLDSVAVACRAPLLPGLPDLLPQACQAASRALDLLCCGRPSLDLRRRLEEALRQLTQMLLHSPRPGRAAEKLKESLVALGSSSVSKSFLVCLILSEIGSLAEQLWQTSQVQESSALRTFPLDRYQNSCHLLWVLERLLSSPDRAWWRPELEAVQTAFLHRLELLVFLLWDEFPLFSILMWRIGKLLV
ncbi:PREDICTED: meiosis-specific protein MEI4-like [Poecilia mexicana]|uniref:Meiotic double-stranded break formation protein 4 n=1 Tax=Poecilia mexicana TaxID=48701 RepID=A0A3B3YW93_9TELE|nr:PREDICTED: meiosis-specific protein MEI4-like [Poecilia mexicana]